MATIKNAIRQLKKYGAKVTRIDSRVYSAQMPAAKIQVINQDGDAIFFYVIKTALRTTWLLIISPVIFARTLPGPSNWPSAWKHGKRKEPMTDTTPTPKKQRGGKRIAGPGKEIGAPHKDGYLILVPVRVESEAEETVIFSVKPRKRAEILVEHAPTLLKSLRCKD